MDLKSKELESLIRLDFDTDKVFFKRVLDTNDRFLRKIQVGLSFTEAKGKYHPETGFDITVASELMAILGLSTSLKDLRSRLANVVVGLNKQGQPIKLEDLGVDGAVFLLLKDAFQPTLIQSLEGSPMLVHTGPFANIAHGNSSVIADQLALNLVSSSKLGYVITEAGFGSDIGLEKFFNIKLRSSLKNKMLKIPDAVILCITIRALKLHGGGPPVVAGKALAPCYLKEDIKLLENGLSILKYHIGLVEKFGTQCIVAINQFSGDSLSELELVKAKSLEFGAVDAVVCNHWAKGGLGAIDLAKSIVHNCQNVNNFELKWIYEESDSIETKIKKVAENVYSYKGEIEFSKQAQSKLEYLNQDNEAKHLPICIAKTQYSITAIPTILNDPTLSNEKWNLQVKDFKWCNGAQFIVVYLGDIQTLPGLPTRPAYMDCDWDFEKNKAEGFF